PGTRGRPRHGRRAAPPASGRCRARRPRRRSRRPLRSGSPSLSAATRSPWRAGPHSSWWSRSRSLLVRGFQVALPEVDMHRRALVAVRPEVAGGEADRVDVLGVLALVPQVRVREDERLVDDADGADLALRI